MRFLRLRLLHVATVPFPDMRISATDSGPFLLPSAFESSRQEVEVTLKRFVNSLNLRESTYSCIEASRGTTDAPTYAEGLVGNQRFPELQGAG